MASFERPFERPVLQVALDVLEIERAVEIAREALRGGVDWIEAGTPLIKSEGMDAVRALRDAFPERVIVADMKTLDTGALEVEMAAKAGADIVIVMGGGADSMVRDGIKAARKYGVKLMADLMGAGRERALELVEMGVDIVNFHVGVDQQMTGEDPLELIAGLEGLGVPVAVAGGLDASRAARAVELGADIVIVGGWITRQGDVAGAARLVRESMDSRQGVASEKKSGGEEVREIFVRVSTANISDAMHRKGAMEGIRSLTPGLKMVGRAVTVQTYPGDWAKTVEAIDLAQRGDVIVIYNGGSDRVAPWGELASLSCKLKGVSGVVIDGGVRDIQEIREMGFPVFARNTVPNAGEAKGLGEVNVEITCGGQAVRPGDYIIGDDNGVVVVPWQESYEIARRSLEVEKGEERIRAEIRGGKTLSQILKLEKWEVKRRKT